jgi:hypothetical protein
LHDGAALDPRREPSSTSLRFTSIDRATEIQMKTVLMRHGINHNMFGKRDPVQYGTITLAEIDATLQALGS